MFGNAEVIGFKLILRVAALLEQREIKKELMDNAI